MHEITIGKEGAEALLQGKIMGPQMKNKVCYIPEAVAFVAVVVDLWVKISKPLDWTSSK